MKTRITSQNKHKPFVSVVIPVFNGASFLRETIKSIQKTTYKDFEIILVDDGSTDASRKLCETLAQQYTNIRFFPFSHNKGLGRVLNFALRQAKGEYICRINQDDLMRPTRIARQVSYLERHPEIVAVGSYILHFCTDGSQKLITFMQHDADIRKLWLMVSPFSDPSVMYRTQTALKVGGYNQGYWPADDVHMWYKLGRVGKLANIPHVLTDVRWHDGAGSIKYFRRNTRVTYKLHRWAHNHVQKAPLSIQAFWVAQLVSGTLFSPQFNWNVYRGLKIVLRGYFGFVASCRHILHIAKTAIKEMIHPIKLSLSGA